jgi:hypothetical protein
VFNFEIKLFFRFLLWYKKENQCTATLSEIILAVDLVSSADASNPGLVSELIF